ncbi:MULTISPECIES: S8 family peptidase [Haloprofundus]|uniref:S8 family peptidase n=1 Tax=Haloprofundus TaxID=1911573 RepID=UPI000E4442F1|nr:MULTISPECIES: S8 family serine peptidase [Haloprofundus]QCJ47441.1 peptidase S8 [Haloprofundus sp. MHR1]
MTQHNRRTFLKFTGTALGGLALGAGTAAGATGADDRFLVDLREVSRADVPDSVEIVHDLSEVDLLVARGDAAAVGGAAATTPDVTVYQANGGVAAEADGPKASEESASHNHDGPATNTELQWDKRVQNVGDLTDKPGDGTFVHDVTKGAGTRVAVVDSGVYDAHPDLADVVNPELSANFTTDGMDFRPNGAGSHGTHVAGTIAATNSNDGPAGGVLGTAPETELLSLRVFSGVEGATGDTLMALVYAANQGCDAANISLGYPYPYVDPEQFPELLAIKEAYRRVAAYAREKEMVIVNSAGNDGLDMDAEGILSLPTEVDGIFGVSATGPIGYGWGGKHSDNEEKWLTGNRLEEETTDPAFYTNYGSAVEVSAAGGDADLDALDGGVEGAERDLVFSTVNLVEEDGSVVAGYGWKAGTSMAAPQVSGAVALVRSLRPDAGAEEVEALIRDTASSVKDSDDAYHGAGHLDLKRLVKAAQ